MFVGTMYMGAALYLYVCVNDVWLCATMQSTSPQLVLSTYNR